MRIFTCPNAVLLTLTDNTTAGGAKVTGTTTTTATFSATAADAGSIAKIQIWVKFVPSSGGLHLFGNERQCLGTTTCSVSKGPYGETGVLSYYAIAWDAAGNVASTGTYSVNVSVEIK